MKSVQLRMARAALGWGVRDLAAKAGVTANTVTRIENGSDAKQSTIDALRAALEAAGMVFIAENGGGAGVRLAEPGTAVLSQGKSDAAKVDDATEAREHAVGAVNRAMFKIEATDEERTDRRDRLTAVPDAVKRMRNRRKLDK